MSLLGQLGRGVAWTYTGMVISGALQVFVVAATARLLSPEAFGLIAMANVVLRFGSYFAQMGVGRALIQRASIDDDDVRAAFTSSTLLGALTTALVIAIAPLAAAYYQTGDVVPVMRWLALTFVVSGFGATARALLQRRLRFRAVSTIEVVSYALGYAVPTLALAASGFGVWSLVAGALGQVTVATTASMILARHGLAPMLRWAPHARLLRFGATVSGISVLEFIGSSLDTLVIGRFGTATQLGIYNRAFMLASLPTYQVNHGIAKVLFPVLSSGRSNPAAFAQALEAATTTAIKLVVPLGVGMALAAPELVRVVLGDGWVEAIPLFAVLAPALAINLIATFPGQALDAVGRLRWKAVVQAVYVVALGSLLVALATPNLDLEQVALALAAAISLRTIAMFLVAYSSSAVTGQLLRSSVRNAAVALGLTSVTVMPAMVLLRTHGASDAVVLVSAIALGGLVLLGLLGRDVVRYVHERRKRG